MLNMLVKRPEAIGNNTARSTRLDCLFDWLNLKELEGDEVVPIRSAAFSACMTSDYLRQKVDLCLLRDDSKEHRTRVIETVYRLICTDDSLHLSSELQGILYAFRGLALHGYGLQFPEKVFLERKEEELGLPFGTVAAS